MEIRCPYCEKTVQVPGGGQFTCPSCRAVFAVDMEPGAAPPAGDPPPLPGGPPPLPGGPPPLPGVAPPPITIAAATGPVCARHPATSANEVCNRCGNFMCATCTGRAPDGSRFCPDCLAAVLGPSFATGGLVAWESERAQKGMFVSYWETMKLCVKEPERFWRTLPPDADMGPAVSYNVFGNTIFTIPLMLVMALLVFLFFGFIVASAGPKAGPQVAAMGGVAAGALAFCALLVPIGAVINLFIGAAIYHVVVMIVGGVRGFGTTVRILGYSKGSMVALSMAGTVFGFVVGFIPILGGMVSMVVQLGIFVWGLVIQYHGFRLHHNLSQGRAIICVLWWVAFFCCAMGGFVALIFSLIAAGAANGANGGGGF